jgi:7-cyano-7-deazaguanine synthase
MQSNTSKALVLLSGGMDSTTCLFWAKNHYDEIHTISFSYGQRHNKELEYAARNAARAQVASHQVVDMTGLTGRSAQVDHSQSTAAQHPMNDKLPSTFTPGRNAIFLSIAAGKAYDLGIDWLVTGVCSTDDAGYPDCRPGFISTMQEALRHATDTHISIVAPLLELTKAETWKLANDLGILDVLVNETLTDYNGDETLNEWGRGKLDNPASELRARGFYEAKRKGWL